MTYKIWHITTQCYTLQHYPNHRYNRLLNY